MQILYTTKVTTSGGREAGHAVAEDGHLDVSLSKPRELGGSHNTGTNPEQLFAAGYSACFLSAIKFVAEKREQPFLDDEASVTATVGLGKIEKGFALAVELRVSLPGLDHAIAESLVNEAHQICPYSSALRNNVDVKLIVE